MKLTPGVAVILAWLLGLAMGLWTMWLLDHAILSQWERLAAECLTALTPRTPM